MPAEIATSDKIACLRREIAMRERVYPGWVRASRMREADAAREIAVMAAILADYIEMRVGRHYRDGEAGFS